MAKRNEINQTNETNQINQTDQPRVSLVLPVSHISRRDPWLCTVEDQSAPIPSEITSKLGGGKGSDQVPFLLAEEGMGSLVILLLAERAP